MLQKNRVVAIDTDGLAFLGPQNAPVVLAVFYDYRCTTHAAFEQTLKEVVIFVSKYLERKSFEDISDMIEGELNEIENDLT